MALDRDHVVKTALTLMDEVGLDGLSLRRLAAELGVQAPALYWHFKNKQDLLDQMAEYTMRHEVPPPRPLEPGEDWRDWLAARARAIRAALVARRDAALLAASTKPRETQWDQIEFQLRILCGVGFPPADATRGLFALSNYVSGFALEEQGERRQPGGTAPDPGEVGEFLTRLAEHQPLLGQAMTEVGDPQGDGNFEYGLRLIIAGMRARLDSARA